MKKSKNISTLLLVVFSFVSAFALFNETNNKNVLHASESVSQFLDLPDAVNPSLSETKGDIFDYLLGYGSISGDKFNSFAYTDSGIILNNQTLDSSSNAAFRWQYKTGVEYDTILRLKIKEDCKIAIHTFEQTNQWATASSFNTALKHNDSLFTLNSKQVKSGTVEDNYYGGTYYARANDIIYFYMHSTSDGQVASITGNITANKEEYSEVLYNVQIGSTNTYNNIFKQMAASKTNTCTSNNIEYSLMYGDIDNEILPLSYVNDGLYTIDGTASDQGVMLWDFQIRGGCGNENAILKMKANEDMAISFNAKATSLWASAIYRMVFETNNSKKELYNEELIANGTVDFTKTYALKANDILYFVVDANDGVAWQTNNFEAIIKNSLVFDEAYYKNQFLTSTISFEEMVRDYAKNNKEISELTELFVNFYYGNFYENIYNDFNIFEVDGLPFLCGLNTSTNDQGNIVQTWQWRAGCQNENVFVKLTAKSNCKVNLKGIASTTWANALYKVVIESNNIQYEVNSYELNASVGRVDFTNSYYLKEGDFLFFIMSAPEGVAWQTCNIEGSVNVAKEFSNDGYISQNNNAIKTSEKHIYKWVEEVKATCTKDGVKGHYECDICNKLFDANKNEISKDTLKIPMAAHEYQDTLSYNEEGHFYKCNNCDAYKSFASHNLTWVIDEEASEEKTGLKHQECDDCKYQTSLNTIIDVLPHTHKMTYVEEVKSTCSKDGNVGYYVCSKCDKTFKDEKGSIEITNVVIKASHKYGKLVEEIKATCSKEGIKAHYQCSSCHEYFNINKEKVSKDELVIEKNPHELVHHEGLKATCTSKGYEAYDTCKNCDYTTYKEIDKLPHEYSNEWTINEDYHYNVCINCNQASGYLKHNYEWIVDEEATCIKFGIQHQECKDCHNKINMGVTIAKKNHTIVEDKEILATCKQEGLSKGSHCSVCNEVIVKQIVINKTSHTIVIDKKVEATCKHTGLSEGSHCSVCDEVIVKQEVIAKKDHSYVWVVDKDATCTQEGIKHEECLNCKAKNNENTTINKKEHVEVIDDELLATCEHTGLSKGSHCLICNEVIKKQEEIAKKEHQLKEVIDKDSTCTTEGLKHEECKVCHSKFNETAIAKKEHEVVEDKAIEATCTKTGLSKGTHCKKCGNVLLAQEVIAKKPHTEVIDKAVEATCSSTGLTIGSHCSECNEILVKQEVVAKKEHTFTDWTKNDNKEVRECSVCHKIETRTLRSSGCKGNIATSIITLINCLGLLIILRKKII